MRPFRLLCLLVVFSALAVGCSKKTEPAAPSEPTAGSSADHDKLQGMWKIESLDDGRPDSPRRQEEIKNDRIKIEGNKFTILADGDEIKFTFTLDESKNPKVMTLTEATEDGRFRRGGGATTAAAMKGGTPKSSNTTKRTEPAPAPAPAREPEKWNWIYKFEGEKLVVAFTKDERKPAPTEFKARARKSDVSAPPGQDAPGKDEPEVTVITLVKTTEPAPPVERRRPVTTRAGTKK